MPSVRKALPLIFSIRRIARIMMAIRAASWVRRPIIRRTPIRASAEPVMIAFLFSRLFNFLYPQRINTAPRVRRKKSGANPSKASRLGKSENILIFD